MGFELIASGIAHRFGPLQVLDDINFNVKQGEIVAIVGPSGCGKSTLLGIIGGLIQPSHGTVSVVGALPAGSLNPFTYIFQDFALLPWRTVAQNVRLPLEHHPLTGRERDQRVKETLRLTGLEDFARALPKQLSGGMKQRVGIARALVVEPAVLLMDEPFSALDAQTRDLLLDELDDIWARENTTAVYVTHNLSEALRMADRIMIMRRRPGRVRQIVPVPLPRSIRKTPAGEQELARLHDELWSHIREEAVIADREIADA